jgi:4-hydroxymandelate oxidase
MGAGEPIDLARIVNLLDFQPLARAAMESGAFEYMAGGSWDEITLGENVAAWRRRTLRPRVLVDVTRVDTATTMLGAPCAMPLAIAPMAEAGTADPDGDVAMARAAAATGIPFILSTFSTRSIEEVADATPDATRWFQLYVEDDRERSRSLVERAAASGYRAIVLTVDLPVSGYRERELRSGFHGPAPVGGRRVTQVDAEGAEPVADRITRSLTWTDLAVIRSWAPDLPLVVKGILSAGDARLAVEHGADAIVVSNHGARQLDRVAATVDALEEVVEAVAGDTEVWVDGGVRRGLDIAIAVAIGARGVLLGRPAFWALAAGGQPGVERALTIVHEELETALALLGTPSLSDITRASVGP